MLLMPSPGGSAADELSGIERLNRAPGDPSFISGNGFASRCGWVLNYGPPRRNERGRRDWYFCKTDRLDELFRCLAPGTELVLFTHNSDRAVDAELGSYLDHPGLKAWFATNVALQDGRVRAIPIGIANPHWPEGDGAALHRVQAAALPRTRLFDASFSVHTNPDERGHCIAETGLAPSPPRPFEPYLAQLASAYFCVSPRGNGIDCHRTWEALYLRTIPVVTRSPLTEHHRDLPLIVLDDWSQFRSIEFSPALYERTMGNWTPAALSLDAYLARLEALLPGGGEVPS
jgi:hypothetical protein